MAEQLKAKLGLGEEYEPAEEVEVKANPVKSDRLIVMLEKKGRGGKQVTLIKGFTIANEDIEKLSKEIKQKLGVGGTVKNGEIIIQGDLRDKVLDFLTNNHYSAKRGN